jgi:CubicO group peptidase (beta-lactamase class C family)
MKQVVSPRLVFFYLFLPATLVGAAAGPPTHGLDVHGVIERVEREMLAEFAKDKLGGVTVGVVSGPNLVWTKSVGFRDREKKIPASKDTVYRIGSITKQFTALMLLQLVEDGKIHLSDPVESYFPEIRKVPATFATAPPITLVQLATHTSGLAVEPDNLRTYLQGPVSNWESVLIAALPHTRYGFEPGTRHSYSNIGYAILGAALARAVGRPYVDYVQDRILQPLGMNHSAFQPNDQIQKELAKGYMVAKGKVDSETPAREHAGRGYKVPNGALYTTVEDLARFVAFEMGDGPESVLSKSAISKNLTRIITTNPGLDSGYGIGFQVQRMGETIVYGHAGGVAGYQAVAFFDRQSKVGVIVLRNVTGGAFDLHNILVKGFAEKK